MTSFLIAVGFFLLGAYVGASYVAYRMQPMIDAAHELAKNVTEHIKLMKEVMPEAFVGNEPVISPIQLKKKDV